MLCQEAVRDGMEPDFSGRSKLDNHEDVGKSSS